MVQAFRHRAEQMMLPRTLLTRFPMGRPLGAAGDRERQTDVVMTALRMLETAETPGTIQEYPGMFRTTPNA